MHNFLYCSTVKRGADSALYPFKLIGQQSLTRQEAPQNVLCSQAYDRFR